MKQKTLNLIAIIVSIIALLYWLATLFSPGSYANTPIYEFNISEQQFIKALDEVRNIEPDLKVPGNFSKKEGTSGHRYYFNIYYKQTDEITHCWVRNDISIPSKCKVALLSIGNNNGHWHGLDRYERKQKKKQLKRFEEVLLDKIAARTNSEYDD